MESRIILPWGLGYLRTESPSAFLADLFGSSSGSVVLSVIMLGLLVVWRCLIDDSEEHDEFVDAVKKDDLDRKWAAHTAKWGTTRPPQKEDWSPIPLPESSTRVIPTTPPTQVTILVELDS